jgi:hypothetical protein
VSDTNSAFVGNISVTTPMFLLRADGREGDVAQAAGMTRRLAVGEEQVASTGCRSPCFRSNACTRSEW